MGYVRVSARVVRDNTGHHHTIPVIMMDSDGRLEPLLPLVDYLSTYVMARSPSWMNRVVQGVGLLLDYMEANRGAFDKPYPMFKAFVEKVYSGTTDEAGLDPSGLYWLPKRQKTAYPLLRALSDFSDWLHRRHGTEPLNPWEEATSYEERLQWAAFINKSERNFLGHLDSAMDASEAARMARSIKHRAAPTGAHGSTKAFPEDSFYDLLFIGFVRKGQHNNPNILEKYNWRNICITLLLHWGGLRESEPFHLWVHDVIENPEEPGAALVRVYHPVEGAAPRDYKGPNGRYLPNREAYLKARHPKYKPRNLEIGQLHAGWKSARVDDVSQQYMHVHWFPTSAATLFMEAWKLYMLQRLKAKVGATEHPFLFVSLREPNKGRPYSIDAYNQSHELAVRRIGLEPSKMNGTSSHGHRHAQGHRTKDAGLAGPVLQAALHHKSPVSQLVYTEPGIAEVTAVLHKANETLANGESMPMVDCLGAFVTEQKRRMRNLTGRK